MITLEKIGDAIKFTFSGNTHYLQDGTVEVPVNSLSLTIDDSGMVTFRKSASNDIFISATYGELGMTKDELVAWYKENMVDGGGSDITSGDVQSMIDESISGKVDTSAITTSVTSASTDAQVPSAKAVYDAIQENSGTSYTAGEGITITGSSNAITLDANIYKGNGLASVSANNPSGSGNGHNKISGMTSFGAGWMVTTKNVDEAAFGFYNKSNGNSDQFTHSSGNTLFSVGNGTNDATRHNAFEIRQNGDIYITSGGTDIKLQDNLGGGGGVNVVQTTGTSTTDVMSQDAVTTQLSGYVTTDRTQIITGKKTFKNSQKAIEFKQLNPDSKAGFTITSSATTTSNNELASFELKPNTFTIDGISHPLMYFGHYRSSSEIPQTVIGFRQYDSPNSAAYHYLLPLPEKAKTPFSLTRTFTEFYAPMGFKNGETMITADNTGVADFSSELDGLKLKKLTQAEYDALVTKDNSTLYIIV